MPNSVQKKCLPNLRVEFLQHLVALLSFYWFRGRQETSRKPRLHGTSIKPPDTCWDMHTLAPLWSSKEQRVKDFTPSHFQTGLTTTCDCNHAQSYSPWSTGLKNAWGFPCTNAFVVLSSAEQARLLRAVTISLKTWKQSVTVANCYRCTVQQQCGMPRCEAGTSHDTSIVTDVVWAAFVCCMAQQQHLTRVSWVWVVFVFKTHPKRWRWGKLPKRPGNTWKEAVWAWPCSQWQREHTQSAPATFERKPTKQATRKSTAFSFEHLVTGAWQNHLPHQQQLTILSSSPWLSSSYFQLKTLHICICSTKTKEKKTAAEAGYLISK